MKTCSNCSIEKNLEEFYYKKTEKRHTSWCRKCYEMYQHKRHTERKRKLVQLMGGGCQRCGYNKCLTALHFHHKDPSEKNGNWTKISRWSWDKVIKEIQKCILLCANCHSEHHAPSDAWNIVPVNDWHLLLDNTMKISGQCPVCKSDVFSTKYCSTKCRASAQGEINRKRNSSKVARKIIQCPVCKADVYGTKYCSNKCRGMSQRKANHPSKKELSELISTNTWTDIAKQYGVSDNAVRKWAKKHELVS